MVLEEVVEVAVAVLGLMIKFRYVESDIILNSKTIALKGVKLY